MILKTKLHRYCVERGSAEAAEIDRLREQTQGDGAGRPMICISDIGHKSRFPHSVETVELETDFLFENQWNEAGENGRRLFDYYEESKHHFKHSRYGHWLEITPEMKAIRESVHTCGYCGKQYPTVTESGFCTACIGSDYLEEKDIRLLRLLPVAVSFGGDRPELAEQERALLIPLYRCEQGLGKENRGAKKLKGLRLKVSNIVAEAEAEAAKKIADAKIEQAGKEWLLDHNYRNIDNVIYYSHSNEWCFGWRSALSADEKSMLTDLLTEFPYDYKFGKEI